MRDATPPPDDAFNNLEQALSRAEDVTDDDCETSPAASRRRTAAVSALFAAAVIGLSAMIAYVAAVYSVGRAEEHTDERIAVLERDLQQRRSVAAVQNATRDSQIAELRRLVCLFADRARPRDEAVESVRARYQCTDASTPPTQPGAPLVSPSR